ncbi:dihydroxyacetone kinase phosphoryl donor subunit DhaM [Sanguibacter antarcticus]|uniref:Phosphocarrier protein HPr n=1 Tax=Sanguibacter antarcticus TaxID=372484 RepID=A0A2A9E5R3_9MICO|nr:dihydroxyacetone kinase phosphoryl donor subunit DhaM [Sanguibacter antarcticus]PFG33572.1 PTS hybrid protein [Sanguibacter antarcticus]
MTAHVAIVLVSHSGALASGVVEVAGQMAPDVALVGVGGTDDGGVGTSFDRVGDAVQAELAAGRDVLVLGDLGSAMLTVESVLDLLEGDDAARVRLADAPFVEGAVAAAVTAQGGGDLLAVVASALHAATTFAEPSSALSSRSEEAAEPASDGSAPVVERTVTVRNALGLHARPAAVLARLVAGLDVALLVDGVNGASVLELMKLGATGGDVLSVRATGADAQHAVDAVAEMVEGGFGEL